MIGLAIAAAVIIAVLLLRVGVSAEYSDDGLFVIARAGFVRIRVYPPKTKKERRKPREHRKRDAREEKKAVKKPGTTLDLKKMLAEAQKLLGKVRRRLLIKDLTVLYVQAGGDPCKMAVTHGASLAAVGLTQAALEALFKVKRYNLHTSVDFLATEPRVYMNATLTIAVWEAITIGFAALMLVLRSRKQKTPATEDAEIEDKMTGEISG